MSAGFCEPALPLWLRAVSRLPFPVLYALSDVLAFIASNLGLHRHERVREQLRRCFPDLAPQVLRRLVRDCYRNVFDVLFEVIKGSRLDAAGLREHVTLEGQDAVREQLATGQPVLLAGLHYANWEWMLLALSSALGVPLVAAYKPLHDARADALLRTLRARLGAELIPAKDLFNDVMRRRGELRAIALVADQDPVSASLRHFTTFLGRETAFYMGAEMIARAAKLPVFLVVMRRTSRGRYRLTLELLAGRDETLPSGAITERYARRVEAVIRERPGDWLWLHRRWKVKKSVYDPS